MTKILRKFSFAAIAIAGLAAASLVGTTAPASARVICDRDGDDCRYVPGYYDRDDYWWQRHAWEERREHDAYRDWYWRHRDRDDDDWDGDRAGIWFNF